MDLTESQTTYYGEMDPLELRRQIRAEQTAPKKVVHKPDCMEYALTGKHILVIGGTGSGKTYFVTRMCERLESYIFVNPQEEVEVEDICQAVTSEPEDILELFGEGITKIEFIPAEDPEEATDQIQEIRLFLFDLGAVINPKGTDRPYINIIVDEAQIFAPKAKRTDIDNIATRGRRYGVRGIFLTQRPQLLSSTVINLCERQIIFRTGQYESKYFSSYNIPIDGQYICRNCGHVQTVTRKPTYSCPRCGIDPTKESAEVWLFLDHNAWLDKRYHSLLWDGRTIRQCTPV